METVVEHFVRQLAVFDDQVMDLGWKVLLPISLLNLFVTALVILW